MAGKVQPLNVSPLIKCARYSILILGYFYGSFRLTALRNYEATERGLRHKMLHEKAERQKLLLREQSIKEVIDVAKDLGVTEFPPGWDSNI